MTKSNICWLIVRLLGLFFIYEALRWTSSILTSLTTASTTSRGAVLLSESLGLISGMAICAAICLLLGAYLLLNGTLIYKLLMSENEI